MVAPRFRDGGLAVVGVVEAEQLSNGFYRAIAVAALFHVRQGTVEDLFDDGLGHGLDASPLGVGELRQPGEGAAQFFFPDPVRLVAEGRDGRDYFPLLTPFLESAYLCRQQGLGLLDFQCAQLEVGLRVPLDVIEVIEMNPGEVTRVGVDVPGDAEIDHDKRAAAGCSGNPVRVQDALRGPSRGDDQVCGGKGSIEVAPRKRLSSHTLSQGLGPLEGAARNLKASYALRNQAAGG